MRVIFAGDIVGNLALNAVCRWVKQLRELDQADFFIVNAENAAEGKGLSPKQAQALFDAGVDCITLGNHAWGNWSLAKTIPDTPALLRPANAPAGWPGQGVHLLEKNGLRLLVLSLLGNVFMRNCGCPFACLEEILQGAPADCPVLVDFHAEATAEKQALAWKFAGRVSAVIGTHTHVQTADERILPGGTALLCDVGMCGPRESVIGMDVHQALRRIVDALPASYSCAKGPLGIRAVYLDIDPVGATRYIKRIQIDENHEGEWRSAAYEFPDTINDK